MREKLKKRVVTGIVLAVILTSLIGCGYSSSVSCTWCGRTPTKAFKTETGETQYYCESCSTKCAICGKKATKHYTNLLGVLMFVCKDHYEAIKAYSK